MVKKTPTTDETPEETGPELARDVFTLALRAIRDEIREIVGGKKPKARGRAGGDPSTRIANLAARAATLAAELRQAEKAQNAATKDLTASMVLAWARQQSPEQRARLRKDLDALDNPNRRSVLA